ncbi:hypothetical protein MPSEU_000603000 [Mayamaea pseudoterrestris]|nr:hypothetical protein MPSEU_000603000 [Mayamaea pseudoterrestris]
MRGKNMSSDRGLCLLLIFFATRVQCFLPTVPTKRLPQSTHLFYRDDKTSHDVLTIPVLDPIPNHLPLLPGKEFVLSSPTPGQWSALEQAFAMHQQQHVCEGASDTLNKGTIQAAPIIALMDEVTLTSGALKAGERYATIAAVVGVSSNARKPTLDLSDASSFMESVREIGKHSFANDNVDVCLVGIGRAALHDFFYEMPAAKRNAFDQDGHLILDTCHIEDDEDDTDLSSLFDKVVMAQFDLLMDGLAKGAVRNGNPSSYTSPVHAISEMNSLAGQIQYLHQERKRLVAGIRAAEARLRAVGEQDELLDHDGIGQLYASNARLVQDVLINDMLKKFGHDSLKTSYFAQDRQIGSSEVLSSKENYGMGYAATTFSTVREITGVWLDKLAPYFSPARQQSEEHYYETLSFVAMLSMDTILEPSQLRWALQCCNTSERLQQASVWMTKHLQLLKEKSLIVAQQLKDCGEECTDLW